MAETEVTEVEVRKYVDLEALSHACSRIKEYIDNSSSSGNFDGEYVRDLSITESGEIQITKGDDSVETVSVSLGNNIKFALWTKSTTLAQVKSAQQSLASDTAMVYVYMNYDILPPKLNDYTYFDAETSEWLTGETALKGINNGDIIFVYKSSAVSTIETIAAALGKSVPHAFIVHLGTAKLADAEHPDFPGVDGKFRHEDKKRIEDVAWRSEKSLFLRDWDTPSANAESAAGAFVAKANTPDSSKEWFIYNTPKKHFSNGYADFVQIAQQLDDPSQMYWRKVSWNQNANAFSHQFNGWQPFNSGGGGVNWEDATIYCYKDNAPLVDNNLQSVIEDIRNNPLSWWTPTDADLKAIVDSYFNASVVFEGGVDVGVCIVKGNIVNLTADDNSTSLTVKIEGYYSSSSHEYYIEWSMNNSDGTWTARALN